MSEIIFIPKQVYKRSEIHAKYGGNVQSGISTSAKSPFIFIFSGKSGHQHGYFDHWVDNNVFSYSGEGQVGDMKYTKGNAAIFNHIEKGKRVFLFNFFSKGYVMFEDELELITSVFDRGKDRNDQDRKIIRFFFKRKNSRIPNITNGLQKLYQSEIENNSNSTPNVTERQGLVLSRIGQGAYRAEVLVRWKFKCAVTGFNNFQILIASHIVPWKASSNFERLDVNNGILLSPVYDALFDKHLISFEDSGKIILSSSLMKYDYQLLGLTGKEVIRDFTKANFPYLERHRAEFSEIS